MLTASIFLMTLILLILTIDKIFMPRKAKKAWQMMAIAYSFAIVFTIFPENLSRVAKIVGIGRGVDLILYIVSLLVVRELFLNRARQSTVERQLTLLTRQLAISQAKLLKRTD